jgi:anhydro-N-acetylmuramic acid kinase
MANLTWVPEAGTIDGVIAFDTGPGVAVVDAIVRRATGDPFDRDGRLAAGGKAVEEVVNTVLEHGYFRHAPPKSTGRELFGDEFAEDLVRRVKAARTHATTADCIATAILLSCRAIGRALDSWIPLDGSADVVASGGGTRNPAVLACLRAELQPAVCVFDEVFFDGDAKEAVAFAYLGWLTLAGEPGNIPAATGARGPRILGRITPA